MMGAIAIVGVGGLNAAVRAGSMRCLRVGDAICAHVGWGMCVLSSNNRDQREMERL